MDPLVLLDQAEAQGTIPRAMVRKVRVRLKYLAGAVQRVEDASGLPYPPYYVEPVLPVASSGAELGQMGVLFARVIPATVKGGLSIFVQFAAALLVFGSRGTIEAVAAHEFTHYFDLVRRLSSAKMLSDERSSTLFESAYADSERVFPPRLLFSDKALVGLVNRKFKDGLRDDRLNQQVGDKWISKNLPMRKVAPEENVVRVGVGSIFSADFDARVLRRIAQLEEKMEK